MQGIAKGTLLANRYALTSEISDAENVARWIAQDEKLGRDVSVTVFPKSFQYAAAALDSARRVAGLEDARIVRVLDAGSDDKHAWVVEEAHLGAHSLADLARFEQLHPEEVRRIVGETASALEAARLRGLHHLQLEPSNVLRLSDGSITLTQLAVGAALAGEDDVSSAEANQIDSLGVARLLYFGLTRRWPGENLRDPNVKKAEKVDGSYPDPSTFTEGVPADLDAFCRSACNSENPARTPGEVAKRVAPWAAHMITAPGRSREDGPSARKAEAEFTVRRASDAPARNAAVGAVGAAALSAATSKPSGSSEEDSSSDGVTSSASSSTTTASAATSRPDNHVARMPSPRPPVQDPADATMVGRRVEFDADETTQFSIADEDRAYSRTSYDPSFEELEPPVPGMSTGVDDPDASSRKLALGIVALFVLGALFLAVLGIKNIGSGSSSPSTPTATRASQPAVAAGPSSKPSPSPSASPSGQPVQLISSSVINSQGYRIADTSSAPKAIDGNPSTAWESRNYLHQTWGGYQGYGGLAIQLSQSTAIKTIKINSGPYPLTADIYVSDTPGTSGTKVGSVTNLSGETTVDAKGAKGSYVTIFVTNMAKTPDGYYKASVAEVSVEK